MINFNTVSTFLSRWIQYPTYKFEAASSLVWFIYIDLSILLQELQTAENNGLSE